MNNGVAVIPPGGLFVLYETLPDGTPFQHYAATEEALINKIRDFRRTNGIPEGDIEAEVKEVTNPKPRTTPKEGRGLRERVTGWTANRQYQKLEFVDPEEAERRAKICAECPFNIKNFADDCQECYRSVERNLLAMRAARHTSQDSKLGACDICGHHNPTAVQLDNKFNLHKVNYEAELKEKHPKCWLLDKQPTKEVE